jgi:asparagine synthase (glutamine-hydrolysing)
VCGIAGIWQRHGEPVPPAAIERFTNSLAHRGPDGAGTYLDEGSSLALGHRRLTILDTSSAGRQPMCSSDGRYRITFNGEIYNFVELRTELETAGYRFITQSDSEVIAAAYDRWGESCQLRFNGMWAFALWDTRARQLFISRDRFGVKPLFYSFERGRFTFASELKAFLSLDGFDVRENTSALARALDEPLAAEAYDDTLLQGVQRLLPGHRMIVTQERCAIARWWSTLDHLVTPRTGLKAQAEDLREVFFEAARIRLRSDVSVATCLSGGLDSSAVLCTLAKLDAETHGIERTERHAPHWRRAFTATYEGTPLDELHYAKLVAAETSIPLDEVAVGGAPTVDELERIVFDLEDVTFTDATPIWRLYRALRDSGITVALNGDGADELFGGYLIHADRALATSGGLRRPRRFLDLIETRYHMPGADGPLARTSRAKLALFSDPALRALSLPARRLYARVRGRPAALAGTARRTWILRDAPGDAVSRCEREASAAGLSALGAYLYGEFHAAKLPAILRAFDRASMAHGVEIRNPFLDWRVVRYAFSLPDESKIGNGFSKRILREAMRGIVPDAVRRRRAKIGFNAPLAQWFAGPLREWLWDTVNAREFLASDLWDGPAIARFVAAKRGGEGWKWGDGEAVWPFLHAHLWRARFLTTETRLR